MARTVVTIVYNYLPRISKRLRPAADEICGETAREIRDTEKVLVPVDTGALRASIHEEKEAEAKWAVLAGDEADAEVNYAGFVNYGTSRMAARPFVEPAAEQARSGFMAKMKDLENRLG